MLSEICTSGTDGPKSPILQDWKVDVQPRSTVDTPSFIRLFVIGRIIKNYIYAQHNNTGDRSTDTFQPLVQCLKDKQNEKIACDILSRLVNDGIKLYMEKWYDEETQASVVEMIFQRTILVKFAKEYQQLTTYVTSIKVKYSTQMI